MKLTNRERELVEMIIKLQSDKKRTEKPSDELLRGKMGFKTKAAIRLLKSQLKAKGVLSLRTKYIIKKI